MKFYYIFVRLQNHLTIQWVARPSIGRTVSDAFPFIDEAVGVPSCTFVYERIALICGGVVIHEEVKVNAFAFLLR